MGFARILLDGRYGSGANSVASQYEKHNIYHVPLSDNEVESVEEGIPYVMNECHCVALVQNHMLSSLA